MDREESSAEKQMQKLIDINHTQFTFLQVHHLHRYTSASFSHAEPLKKFRSYI